MWNCISYKIFIQARDHADDVTRGNHRRPQLYLHPGTDDSFSNTDRPGRCFEGAESRVRDERQCLYLLAADGFEITANQSSSASVRPTDPARLTQNLLLTAPGKRLTADAELRTTARAGVFPMSTSGSDVDETHESSSAIGLGNRGEAHVDYTDMPPLENRERLMRGILPRPRSSTSMKSCKSAIRLIPSWPIHCEELQATERRLRRPRPMEPGTEVAMKKVTLTIRVRRNTPARSMSSRCAITDRSKFIRVL